tara:strand:- start:3789 stop:4376 length:588 start_codon:yes stop_codon:yes gene_type:complete
MGGLTLIASEVVLWIARFVIEPARKILCAEKAMVRIALVLIALIPALTLAAPIDFKYDPDVRRPVEKPPKITDPFLIENGKRDGVKLLESGLQVEILSDGYGRMPKFTDTVIIDYQGWLTTGLVFDSSYKRGRPGTFQVAGLVPGFSEGLQHIRMGGKARLYIPSYLGYGKKGSGETIPPDSTLVFEIEVLDVIE